MNDIIIQRYNEHIDTINTQAEIIRKLTEALEQIASSPEVSHPADLLKLLAQQALEEVK